MSDQISAAISKYIEQVKTSVPIQVGTALVLGVLLWFPMGLLGAILPLLALGAWHYRDKIRQFFNSSSLPAFAPGTTITAMNRTFPAPEWLIRRVQNWHSYSAIAKKAGNKKKPAVYALYYEHVCYAAAIERYKRGLPVVDRTNRLIPLEYTLDGFPIVETINEDNGEIVHIICTAFQVGAFNRHSEKRDQTVASFRAVGEHGRAAAHELRGVDAAEHSDTIQLMAQLKKVGLYPIQTHACVETRTVDHCLVPVNAHLEEIIMQTADTASAGKDGHGAAQFGSLG